MNDIQHRINTARKGPPTAGNLNYIGDLYLKMGDRQTALSHYYEAAEKLHLSQKDKKIAIYKKILNISSSESLAYEKLINIFSRMGLVAEERRYLLMFANLCQNKGEHNKLDALTRRINEIDSEDQGIRRRPVTGRPEVGPVAKEDRDFAAAGESRFEQKTAGDPYKANEAAAKGSDNVDEFQKEIDEADWQGRMQMTRANVISYLLENRKKISLFACISFLLILSGFSLYLYSDYSKQKASSLKKTQTQVQTNNYEITVMRITDLSELAGKIDENARNTNLFYALSIKAKNACLDEYLVSNPYAMLSFLDKSGNHIKMHDLKGLNRLTRTVFRANICGKDTGAVFMRVIFAHDKNVRYSGISIDGVEKDAPTLIRWD